MYALPAGFTSRNFDGSVTYEGWKLPFMMAFTRAEMPGAVTATGVEPPTVGAGNAAAGGAVFAECLTPDPPALLKMDANGPAVVETVALVFTPPALDLGAA